jgi:hypothetical protein
LWRWIETRQDLAQKPAREQRVSPEKYKRNLEAIADAANEHGAQALMLVFGRRQLSKHRQMAWQVHFERRVPIVVYGGPRLDMVHPTVEGYDELVAQVLDAFDQARYLKPRQSDRPVADRDAGLVKRDS